MLVPQTQKLSLSSSSLDPLSQAISKASSLILSQQSPEGYWWYTLEANESINAEFILLTHYLGCSDQNTDQRIAKRILSQQRLDGSWSLYFEGSGDISTTIECYFVLKMLGYSIGLEPLAKARNFILSHGGLTRCRVFTRIHLALFGLVPWKICPNMPVGLIQFPTWFPINIYEFSSWARACIVPLLVIMDQKRVCRLAPHFLDELYLAPSMASSNKTNWSYNVKGSFLSSDNFFIQFDRLLGKLDQWKIKPFHQSSLKKCETWIREHIARTEDIYPALAYSAMALYSLGYPVDDPGIQKCLKALRSFQMNSVGADLCLPASLLEGVCPPFKGGHTGPPLQDHSRSTIDDLRSAIYQQCCISPVWDTPWAGVALLEASSIVRQSDSSIVEPVFMKTAEWLKSKQILEAYGDWSQKNKKTLPGGWSFEFENDFFPDIDDTIQVLNFLLKLNNSDNKFEASIDRGLEWVLSMQSKNGGWGAFDLDNTLELVNKIPFSDHGACLDPPTPDITGRAIELLALYCSNAPSPYPLPRGEGGRGEGDPWNKKIHFAIQKAVTFIERTQESWGPWWGRWGVNYIYGTWCVLQGLQAIGYDLKSERVKRALMWLQSVQNKDGGFGESCDSYRQKRFVPLGAPPLPCSVPSQTAWALMALIAGGEGKAEAAAQAAQYLMDSQNKNGSWDESYHTGTGFPGHFYIRYHGYQHYFPLLALAKYKKC